VGTAAHREIVTVHGRMGVTSFPSGARCPAWF
jgi:hypothetical protein